MAGSAQSRCLYSAGLRRLFSGKAQLNTHPGGGLLGRWGLDVWLFWVFASGEKSGPRRLYNWVPDVGFLALRLAGCLPRTPLSHIQKPQHNHTSTHPELRCSNLVRSEGTNPMVAGIILSLFWYQSVSLFCPLLKARRSMVWAGPATM